MSAFNGLDGNEVYGMVAGEGLDHDPFAKVRAVLAEIGPAMGMLDEPDQEFLMAVESNIDMQVPIDQSTAVRLVALLQKARNLIHLSQG